MSEAKMYAVEQREHLIEKVKEQAAIIAKAANELLAERDAQSLLLDRIQYYVDMGMAPGSESCDVAHALGHIAQELKEYAEYHLLGKYPPCVVQLTNDEALLRDGTRICLRKAGTNEEFPEAGLVLLELLEPERVSTLR